MRIYPLLLAFLGTTLTALAVCQDSLAGELPVPCRKPLMMTMGAVVHKEEKVVLVQGNVSDLELREIQRPRGNEGQFVISGISSSGAGTPGRAGEQRIPFASIETRDPNRGMRLVILVASEGGVITRSDLAWEGDYIPGMRLDGRMHTGHASGAGI